ncbi:hypothetical protein ABIC75_004155 [Dyella japonica]|uniref:Uncharacterized protein n=1 Tax=Dyella japonica TaxID=231455 RepID=A0ABV2K012_9GAMM
MNVADPGEILVMGRGAYGRRVSYFIMTTVVVMWVPCSLFVSCSSPLGTWLT